MNNSIQVCIVGGILAVGIIGMVWSIRVNASNWRDLANLFAKDNKVKRFGNDMVYTVIDSDTGFVVLERPDKTKCILSLVYGSGVPKKEMLDSWQVVYNNIPPRPTF